MKNKMLNSIPIKFYKKKYNIVFYDNSDEVYLYGFNNILEICSFKQLDVTYTNCNMISVELYRALKRPKHTTYMLGELMHVYLIDMLNDE